MHPRALELARTLRLAPHPEGGSYREIHRSSARVRPSDERGDRSALTVIHFLLVEGGVSRFHRVRSDEVWTWLEGAPLELATLTPDLERASIDILGASVDDEIPVRVVPADHWQGARTLGAYTLVACMVGPGFEFDDFTLIDEDERTGLRIEKRHPELARYVRGRS
jgi:uncharacterized protein